MRGPLLVGEFEGSTAALAVVEPGRQSVQFLARATVDCSRFAGPEEVAAEFLAEHAPPVDRAVFSVAGPVVDGRAALSNRPWVCDERFLRDRLEVPAVRLINDLQAVGYALPVLTPRDVHTLKPGREPGWRVRSIVAPETGLGEAFLTWTGSRYEACASEGGHADFAPRDARQMELLRFLLERYDHVSYERVCSLQGIRNLYDFLASNGAEAGSPRVAERLATDGDPLHVVRAALDGTCPLSVATLRLFATILGAEAGNLALKVLSAGGVYVGGRLAPQLLPFLRTPEFLNGFLRKGRMAPLLESVPVHVIMNPDAALIGAARYGFSTL